MEFGLGLCFAYHRDMGEGLLGRLFGTSEWKKPKKSVGEFLDAVTAIREYWKPNDDEELWFRGERKYRDTRLCPQLYRPPERQPLKPVSDLVKIEWKLYDDFRRCGAQLSNGDPDEWDWYFLMQHHGGPTRILDWTDGALIGLHFALRNNDLAPKDDAVVYVLQPYLLSEHLKSLSDYDALEVKWKQYCHDNPAEDFANDEWDYVYLPIDDELREQFPLPRVPLLYDTAHVTRRFGAQRSRFMLLGSNPLWVQKMAGKTDWVKVITIDSESIPKIRGELRQAGVTESVIFPDLDGLGRELLKLWEERR